VDNVVALRLAERILSVLIGGMSIYLGYRLFLAIPEYSDSEGRFKLPWSTSIVLSRIGPGVFFALFGSIVVGSSFYRSIHYDERLSVRNESSGRTTSTAEVTGRFSGAASAAADGDARADARMRLQRDIAVLNTIPSLLDPHLSPENRSVVDFALPRIKLALMESVWSDSWGDPQVFRQWTASPGAKVPSGIEKAVEYFRYGTSPKP
jgi:hypothetical protein